MPVPTDNPQRSPCRGRRSHARVRDRLVRRRERERVRAGRELEQPPVVDHRARIEALHLGGDARRETRRVEDRDRRAHAAPRLQRRPRRRDVVARRRDQAEPGDRDASSCGHVREPTRAVATGRSCILATTRPRAIRRRRRARPITASVSPGGMNARTLTSCMPATRAPSPAAAAASVPSASISSVAGYTGLRGKWSAKYGASAGIASVPRGSHARHRARRSRAPGRRRREKRAGARAGTDERREVRAQARPDRRSRLPGASVPAHGRGSAPDAPDRARGRGRRRRSSVALSSVDLEVERVAWTETSRPKRVSPAKPATGRTRKSSECIATQAASCPTASAARLAGKR